MWKRTGEELRCYVENKQKKDRYEPPKSYYDRYEIKKCTVERFPCYELKPRTGGGRKHIIFMHGGGYVLEITSMHWEFIGKLIDRTQVGVTVPIYPLAPRYTYRDTMGMLQALYSELLTQHDPGDVIFAGDSAGGGMSLAFAMLLKEKGFALPGQLILISPALDMTFCNPEVSCVEKRDPILATPAIVDCGKWYADNLNLKHYLISPLYGDVQGLCPIRLFTGTDDICNPDARKFKAKAEAQGIAVDYYEYPEMLHVWPFFGLPESKQAVEQIVEAIEA
ncbi:alpha/beta hydrolase fold domain-containing protein [Paenibacillus cremeus]|nr:alpha/beta hydrolase [Paenibacillus cremeus]